MVLLFLYSLGQPHRPYQLDDVTFSWDTPPSISNAVLDSLTIRTLEAETFSPPFKAEADAFRQEMVKDVNRLEKEAVALQC